MPKQEAKKGVYTKRKQRLNSWNSHPCSLSISEEVSENCDAGILCLRSTPGCKRRPHRSINTSLSNGSKKQMKLARRTSPCVACGAPIVVDTPIAPLLGQNGRIRLCINQPFHLRRDFDLCTGIRWVHAACAPATPQPCPHWVRRGVCHLGDNCALAHPPLVDVPGCVEIKILRRVRAESSRRPPRHQRNSCSMAWRCRFLAARPSQDGRVIAESPRRTG